ncbi:MAG: M1 family metallopeptidase [Clostridiales bacterium]|nr:M1 family metallopeptidase [Clostridiales bacterium]
MEILSKRKIKVYKVLLAIIVVAIIITLLLALNGVFGPKFPLDGSIRLVQAGRGLNQYEIKADFDPDSKTLTCYQSVLYKNTSDDLLTHIYFHLYPNAFQYEDKAVFEKSDMNRAYPNGFSPGFLDFSIVRINGEEADYVLGGYSDDILMLLLEDDLAPDEELNIEMEYTVLLPDSMGRFGYGENMYKVVNWYPIACVYDEDGWNLDPYYAIGDPFYSDVANYKVSIKAPEDYVLATSGEVKSKKKKGEEIIWQIHAPAVRDFAWLASNTFKTASRKVGKTLVSSYFYTTEAGERALDYAAASLAYFNNVFGEYPYSNYAVVESDLYIGGMEYPNLIMLDHGLYQKSNIGYLELVTVHETAHQWWYGLVGNNQITDAWMDEGLTEYSTVLYYGNRYGEKKEQDIYQNIIGEGKYNILSSYWSLGILDETIHRPIYEFVDWTFYDMLVYGKGAMLFHSLREEMGDEKFFQGLQKYYRDNQFQNARKSDLIHAFDQVTGLDWQKSFNRWLYDKR